MSYNWRTGIALVGLGALLLLAARAWAEPPPSTAPATTTPTTTASTHPATTQAAATKPATTQAASRPTSLPSLPTTLPAVAITRPQPIPTDAEITDAHRLVKGTFTAAYADMSRNGRRALGNQLLQRARTGFDAPAARYVLLSEARDAFADGGDAVDALLAVEELARQFKIDTRAMRYETIQRAASKAETDADYAALTASGISLVDETFARAATPEDFAAAARLGMATVTWAAASHDGTLMMKSRAWNSDVQATAAEATRVTSALEKLKAAPNDADANTAVGKFRCFFQNDWSLGLPLLAKGSDGNIAGLARLELTQPSKIPDQLKLADAWWTQSQSATGLAKSRLLQRACLWYGRIYPKVSGQQRNHVERRLTEAGYTTDDLQDLR